MEPQASRSLVPSVPWPGPPPNPRPLLWPLSFRGAQIATKPTASGGWVRRLSAQGGVEGQGCHLEKWQRGLSTWLALLAQHPLAGWPAEAGVGPLRPPCSPGHSQGGTPPLSVTDS